MIKTKKWFLFLGLIMVLFISCLGKGDESEGTDVVEVSEEPESEVIQAPEHPEGLEFVDVVPGEWDVIWNIPSLESIENPDEGGVYNYYLIFLENNIIEVNDERGTRSGSWSYNSNQNIFIYDNGRVYRYRVISYNQNEMELLVLIDNLHPLIQSSYSQDQLEIPQLWRRK